MKLLKKKRNNKNNNRDVLELLKVNNIKSLRIFLRTHNN